MTSKLAIRYARALILIGKERNEFAKLRGQLQLLMKIWKDEPKLKDIFSNIQIPKGVQTEIVNQISKAGELDEEIKNFLCLLVKKEHFYLLEEILDKTLQMLNKILDEIDVEVHTAIDISQELTQKLTSALATIFKKTINVTQKTDKDLIGGIKLVIDDKVFDGTICTELENMKNFLASNVFMKQDERR